MDNCSFGSIKIGDLFLNNKNSYMKVGSPGINNLAVNISNGKIKMFNSFSPVRPIYNAQIKIKIKE